MVPGVAAVEVAPVGGDDPSQCSGGPRTQRWSLPLDEITPRDLERVLVAITTKQDDRPVSAVARRRKNTVSAVLRAAVRRDLINRNPVDRVEWKTPSRVPTTPTQVSAGRSRVSSIGPPVRFGKSRFLTACGAPEKPPRSARRSTGFAVSQRQRPADDLHELQLSVATSPGNGVGRASPSRHGHALRPTTYVTPPPR